MQAFNRNGIGIDINKRSIEITSKRLQFNTEGDCKQKVYVGDATNLASIQDASIDFICTHPPYANIIQYSADINGNLSLLRHKDFLNEMGKVTKELCRVLKMGNYCSFMIGDIRVHKNVIPLGFLTMDTFIKHGFTLKEIIIKEASCISVGKNLYL